MPRRSWKIPFAVAGDTSSIPTAAQSDGSVSIQQGYGPDYERPTDGTDPLGKVFPRTPFNGLANEITASIGEIQQYGFAIWADDMAPYPAAAWVRHAGKVWQNTIDSNSAAPDAVNSGWSAAGSSGGRLKITASSTFVVPDGVTTIYLSGAGGGGGGGGGGGRRASGQRAGGGGGGGAGRSIISEPFTVTGGQSINITIGSGGAAGTGGLANGNGGNGGNGGTTTAGTLVSLLGGTGGIGSVIASGGPGGSPGGQWGTDGSTDDIAGSGGSGGSGPFGTAGGGARGGAGAIITPGTVGFGFGTGGAGGGGSYALSSGPGGAGTAGMPGILLIEW